MSAFIPLLFHFDFVVSVSLIFEKWGKYWSFFKVKAFSRYFWIAWTNNRMVNFHFKVFVLAIGIVCSH